MHRFVLTSAALLLAALAIACGGNSESAPSATSTPRPESTATRPAATPTTAPTATPIPATNTPEPPTPEPPTPEPPTPEPPAPPVNTPPVGGPPSGGPPAGPPVSSGPVSATITASGLAFTTRTINARSGASVTVTLNNQDAFVPHDLTIPGVAAIASCTGPCTSSTTFTAPAAGNYPFLCTIHPDMTGTLRVAP